MNTLETPRLSIRPFTMDDLEEAARLLDEELEWNGPGFTLEQRREDLRFQIGLAGWEELGCLFGQRAIVWKETGEIAGMIAFAPTYWNAWCEQSFGKQRIGEPGGGGDTPLTRLILSIQYGISPRFQCRGVATEAARALVEHVFREWNFHGVTAATDRENRASQRVMEKIGMRLFFRPGPPDDKPDVAGIIDHPALRDEIERSPMERTYEPTRTHPGGDPPPAG